MFCMHKHFDQGCFYKVLSRKVDRGIEKKKEKEKENQSRRQFAINLLLDKLGGQDNFVWLLIDFK